MNLGRAHERRRQFDEPKKLWDDPSQQEQSLGCPTCLERHRCGGVHTSAGIVDCRDLCTCADRRKCDLVCRFNPSLFVARMREVGGLDFSNAPRTSANGVPTVPSVVPFVDHRYSRVAVLDEPVVALSLYKLINFTTGKLQVTSRSQLAARFQIREDAEVIVSGVGKDRPIERWWNSKDRVTLMASLNELGVTIVTTPNYSVLTDVPRTDNLHAMKRILLTWTEMASAGLATALHVNARTEHDYLRWSDLIRERPEIEVLAFEFASGCGWGERIDWHVSQLCRLADRVARPLAIVVRGGGRKLVELRQHFAQVTLVETDAFARTIRRRRAYLSQTGRLKWAKFRTPVGAPIDELLAHNVKVVRASYERRPHSVMPSRPAPRRSQRTAHCDGEAAQPRLLEEFYLASEARRVTPDSESVVTTAKS